MRLTCFDICHDMWSIYDFIFFPATGANEISSSILRNVIAEVYMVLLFIFHPLDSFSVIKMIDYMFSVVLHTIVSIYFFCLFGVRLYALLYKLSSCIFNSGELT